MGHAYSFVVPTIQLLSCCMIHLKTYSTSGQLIPISVYTFILVLIATVRGGKNREHNHKASLSKFIDKKNG